MKQFLKILLGIKYVLSKYLSSLMKIVLLTSLAMLLTGCGSEYVLLDPKGWVGKEIKWLIIFSFLIMLIVVIPVMVMTVWFSVKYHESKDSEYTPDWEHSNKVEFWVWVVPLIIIIILGVITYKTSHSLDPRKPIVSENPTMRIHVVAMDWKWLFIYPEDEIAVVNELAIPVNTPVEFIITSDTVMNSFFIPQLGGQVYAMAGMENRMYSIADEVGVYKGYSANYSGFGFSGMKFKTHAVSNEDFAAWKSKVKQSGAALDKAQYKELQHKTKSHPIEYYSKVNPLMFNEIVEHYTGKQNDK